VLNPAGDPRARLVFPGAASDRSSPPGPTPRSGCRASSSGAMSSAPGSATFVARGWSYELSSPVQTPGSHIDLHPCPGRPGPPVLLAVQLPPATVLPPIAFQAGPPVWARFALKPTNAPRGPRSSPSQPRNNFELDLCAARWLVAPDASLCPVHRRSRHGAQHLWACERSRRSAPLCARTPVPAHSGRSWPPFAFAEAI